MPSTQFDREQIKKLYEQIPERLREALASIEIPEKVDEICQKYGVKDPAAIDTTYRLCGDVLLGLLPPDQFEDAIVKEVKINKNQLSPFMRELNRYILYPYKPELNQLYGVKPQSAAGEPGIPTPRHSERVGVADQKAEQAEEEDGYMVEEPAQSQEGIEAGREPKRGPDTYREPLE